MGQPVTVGSMVTKVQLLGDYLVVDGDYSGDAPRAPATGTIIGWIDWANKRVWNELTDTDEDYALSRYILTTVQGSGTYALPDDYLKVRAVEMSPANESTGWVPLRRATVDDDRWSTDGTMSNPGMWGYPAAYRTFGDGTGNRVVELLPYPSSPLSVRVSYVPVAPTLSSSLQTVDAINGYDEVVVLRALIYSRAREGQDSSDFQLMLRDAWDQMVGSVKRSDRAAPRRMRDRRDGGYGNWRRGPYR